MKLLVVEDEQKLAQYLQKGLGTAGFVVDLAHDGVTGLHMSLEFDYSAIILDSMLPGMDGLALLAALRTQKQTPVLMLTALGKVEDRVNGLQTGADDYLVKPFAFSELIARIQGLLRRSAQHQPESTSNRLALHDLEMDLARRKVSRNGQRIDLSAKEFLLLSLFLRKQGEVLSRTEIAEQVWDMNFDSNTNVVEVSIKRLRAKMDTPFETPLLHTVRGMGYPILGSQQSGGSPLVFMNGKTRLDLGAAQSAIFNQPMVAQYQGMSIQAGLDAAPRKRGEVGETVFREIQSLGNRF